MAAALTLAVVVLAPRGRRLAAFGWWFLPAVAGGAFWYLRNLVVAGNPIPEVDRAGWFGIEMAKDKILPAQAELLDRLLEHLRSVDG